jgi:hypothetical protein
MTTTTKIAGEAMTDEQIRKSMTGEQIRLERKLTCEAIDGAMAFGYQNTNPPPSDDHWLAPYWKIGRKQAEMECALLASKPAVAPPVDEKAEWQAFLDWAWKKEGEAIGRMEGRDAVWAGWHARAMLAAATAPAQSCGDAEQADEAVTDDARRWKWLKMESTVGEQQKIMGTPWGQWDQFADDAITARAKDSK